MTEPGSVEWRYADDAGVGVDDTTNVMTLTDGRRVETRAHLLAVLTEWHHDLGTPTASELDDARRILGRRAAAFDTEPFRPRPSSAVRSCRSPCGSTRASRVRTFA